MALVKLNTIVSSGTTLSFNTPIDKTWNGGRNLYTYTHDDNFLNARVVLGANSETENIEGVWEELTPRYVYNLTEHYKTSGTLSNPDITQLTIQLGNTSITSFDTASCVYKTSFYGITPMISGAVESKYLSLDEFLDFDRYTLKIPMYNEAGNVVDVRLLRSELLDEGSTQNNNVAIPFISFTTNWNADLFTNDLRKLSVLFRGTTLTYDELRNFAYSTTSGEYINENYIHTQIFNYQDDSVRFADLNTAVDLTTNPSLKNLYTREYVGSMSIDYLLTGDYSSFIVEPIFKISNLEATGYLPTISTRRDGSKYYVDILAPAYIYQTDYRRTITDVNIWNFTLSIDDTSITEFINKRYENGYYKCSAELTATQYYGTHTYYIDQEEFTIPLSHISNPFKFVYEENTDYMDKAVKELRYIEKLSFFIRSDGDVEEITNSIPAVNNLTAVQDDEIINSISVSWDMPQEDITNYRISLFAPDQDIAIPILVDGTNYTFRNVKYYSEPYKVSVVPLVNTISGGYTSQEITMQRLPIPNVMSRTRESVNSVLVSWTTSHSDNEYTEFNVYAGTQYKGTTNNLSFLVSDLVSGTYIFGVSQRYIPDDDYNSDIGTVFPINLTTLPKPTFSFSNVYSNITFTDASGVEYYFLENGTIIPVEEYTDGDIKQGVSGLTFNVSYYEEFTYSPPQIEYYYSFNDGEYTYDTVSSELTRTVNIGNIVYGAAGHYKVKVRLIYSDPTYNSQYSDAVEYEINTLSAPVPIWGDENNENPLYQSRVEWLPVETTSQSGDYADFYLVEVFGNDVRVGKSISILQPVDDLMTRVGTWIPDPDPLNGAYKGLISQLPSQTTDYKINVRALSFNSWYVGGSSAAQLDYRIIRLPAPSTVEWDANTFTLSWSPVVDANTYYIYDDGIQIETIADGSTSYTFPNLEDDLHKFTITAMKRTFMEV